MSNESMFIVRDRNIFEMEVIDEMESLQPTMDIAIWLYNKRTLTFHPTVIKIINFGSP